MDLDYFLKLHWLLEDKSALLLLISLTFVDSLLAAFNSYEREPINWVKPERNMRHTLLYWNLLEDEYSQSYT